MKWVLAVIALLLLTGAVLALVDEGDFLPISGVLNSAGGAGHSLEFELVKGSLGESFQTGRMQSSRFKVESGFLVLPDLVALPGLVGDFDGNKKVEFTDFLIFAQGYDRSRGQEGYVALLDLDGSGTVGFSDFVAFAQAYGG
jgi:hypothetical protein